MYCKTLIDVNLGIQQAVLILAEQTWRWKTARIQTRADGAHLKIKFNFLMMFVDILIYLYMFINVNWY